MPTAWQSATVVSVTDETHRAKTCRLRLEAPQRRLAGQHYVVRLTAPDGYTALRSYSVASAPDGTDEIDLTVERLEDGEVSTFLHDVVVAGDELQVRRPIGGWFVWDGDTPAVLVGGGSGAVPLVAMLRQARRGGPDHPLRLVVSVRAPEDLLYAGEMSGPDVTVVYTRRPPQGWTRPPRAADGRRPAAGAGGQGLRLRLQRLRRHGDRPAHPDGRRGRRHPRREVRADGGAYPQ